MVTLAFGKEEEAENGFIFWMGSQTSPIKYTFLVVKYH